jgi:protein-S-isoprenylcysteine O-methyltransferase Ste14
MSDAGNAARVQRPVSRLQIGPLVLTGAWAFAGLFVLLGMVVGLVIWQRPAVRMLLSAGLWVLFVLYWSAAARHVAPVERSESAASRRLHQYLMNGGLLLLFIPVPGLTGRFLPLWRVLVAAGLGVQAAAALLAVWARRHLGRNWSGAVAITAGQRLVQTGPYRRLRHPIYTGMIGMFLGTAVVSGEWHAALAVALLVVAYWRKIRIEERTLGDAFGSAYADYRRHTWALIPGVW